MKYILQTIYIDHVGNQMLTIYTIKGVYVFNHLYYKWLVWINRNYYAKALSIFKLSICFGPHGSLRFRCVWTKQFFVDWMLPRPF